MNISNFTLASFSKKNFDKEVWIPLRVSMSDREGIFGYEGYSSTFYTAASVGVPLDKIEAASKSLNWTSNSLIRNHRGYVRDSVYYPADILADDEFTGVNLVIVQQPSNGHKEVWHINPDIVSTLKLHHEDSNWLAIEEQYTEVIRYKEEIDGTPKMLEMRAEFLKDYLCARGLALCIALYAEKDKIVKDIQDIDWNSLEAQDLICESHGEGSQQGPRHWIRELSDGKWESEVMPIHEGGHPFGSGMAIVHIGRKYLDQDQSVPELSHLDEVEINHEERRFTGSILYRVISEIRRYQWIQPAPVSVRVREDVVPPTASS